MTQRQLADAAEVTVSAVCLWEKGGNITHAHLDAVVRALGLTMVEFFGRPPRARRTRAAA